MKFEFTAICYDKSGKILSTAQNSYSKTHPLQKHFASLVGESHKAFLHAEIAAIIKARGKEIHHIHVQRFGKEGRSLNAKPCKICQAAINAYNIKYTTYTKQSKDY